MAGKLPWFKFWADKWLSDERLRSCSLAARGLWADMISLMHKNERLPLAPDEAARGSVRLALRQEDIHLATQGDGLAAEVRTRVYLGARSRYVLSLAGQPVRVLASNDTFFEPGQRVALAIAPERIRVLAR